MCRTFTRRVFWNPKKAAWRVMGEPQYPGKMLLRLATIVSWFTREKNNSPLDQITYYDTDAWSWCALLQDRCFTSEVKSASLTCLCLVWSVVIFFFLYAKTDTSLACVSGVPGVVHVPNISAFTGLFEMDSPTAATPRNVVSFKLYVGY